MQHAASAEAISLGQALLYGATFMPETKGKRQEEGEGIKARNYG
jgi:hypothetical protein